MSMLNRVAPMDAPSQTPSDPALSAVVCTLGVFRFLLYALQAGGVMVPPDVAGALLLQFLRL